MTRSLSQELQSITAQPFVVMNKPGATGIIAAQFVKSAPHDGYTVLIGTGSQMSVLPALKPNVPFDAEKDFVPISLLGTTPYVLLVNSFVPAKTLPELIALLRANPEKFNYSTSGFGSLPHLAGEMFRDGEGRHDATCRIPATARQRRPSLAASCRSRSILPSPRCRTSKRAPCVPLRSRATYRSTFCPACPRWTACCRASSPVMALSLRRSRHPAVRRVAAS